MALPRVTIGDIEIEVSESHIYVCPGLSPTYDYVPWNIIGAIIQEANLTDVHMVDIGANVGDSLAQFRRVSDAPVTCVEPSDHFFEILARNANKFRNITLENKLLCPPHLIGKVHFDSGRQTGYTSLKHDGKIWTGQCITLDQILQDQHINYIVKTDTDGFDADIVNSLLYTSKNRRAKVPIIFFEGPSAQQYIESDIDNWLEVMACLQDRDYRLLFMSNTGMPYAYAGKNFAVARSILQALTTGYSVGRALCHYYDVIAVAESANSNIITLEKKWESDLFRISSDKFKVP